MRTEESTILSTNHCPQCNWRSGGGNNQSINKGVFRANIYGENETKKQKQKCKGIKSDRGASFNRVARKSFKSDIERRPVCSYRMTLWRSWGRTFQEEEKVIIHNSSVILFKPSVSSLNVFSCFQFLRNIWKDVFKMSIIVRPCKLSICDDIVLVLRVFKGN